MKTSTLKTELVNVHEQLWKTTAAMEPALQTKQPNGKWSAVQHVQHINKGTGAVAKYLTLDKTTIGQTFGLAEKPSRSFDEIMAFFKQYVTGAVSTERFMPEASEQISFAQENQKGKQFVEGLVTALDQWTEEDLDKYVCPHPLLGKLTAREMVYFTLFHAKHHLKTVENIG
jgi:hypothetical protein